MKQSEFVETALRDWQRLKPDSQGGSLIAYHLLVWCGRLLEDAVEKAAVASGFRKRGDYEVLALVYRRQPELLTPVEVGRNLRISPSGVTGKIDRLSEQGFLDRGSDTTDRRIVRLEITPEGIEAVEAAFEMSIRVYEASFDPLSKPELSRLEGLLKPILKRVDELASVNEPWTLTP